MRIGAVIAIALVCVAAGADPKPDPPRCRKSFSLGPNKLVLDDQYVCIDDGQLRDILRAEKQNDADQVSALLGEGCETLGEPMKASAAEVVGGEIVLVRLYNKRGESMEAYTTKAAIIDAGDRDTLNPSEIADAKKEVRPDDAKAIRAGCARDWSGNQAAQICCIDLEIAAAVGIRSWREILAGGDKSESAKELASVDECLAEWVGADLHKAHFTKASECEQRKWDAGGR